MTVYLIFLTFLYQVGPGGQNCYSWNLFNIVHSLASGGFDYSLKLVNFKLISTKNISIFCEIAIR